MMMEHKNKFGHVKKIDGCVREIPDNVEETRTIKFTISNERKDRHGTVLTAEGWLLKDYNKNPVVGYQHNVYGDSWFTEPDPKYVLGIGNAYVDEQAKELIGEVKFEPKEINDLAETVFRKIIFGSLRAASVGFLPKGKGRWGEGIEAVDGKNPTYYYGPRELIEFSIVNIPSNPNALKRSLEEQKNELYAYIREILGEKFTPEVIDKMTIGQLVSEKDGEDNGDDRTMSYYIHKIDSVLIDMTI